MKPGPRDGAFLLLLLAPLVAVLAWGSPAAQDVVVKMGPNTGLYLAGFPREYEIADGQATRWTGAHARVDPPVVLRQGPVEVAWRFSRVLPQTEKVQVSAGGGLVDAFDARGGAWITRAVVLPAGRDLGIALDVGDGELGVKLDWVRWRALPGGRIALSARAGWRLLALVAGFYLLFRLGGQSAVTALALAAPVLAAALAGAWLDPYALAHVVLRIALPALVLGAALLLALKRVDARRWLLPLVLLAYLVKGAGWFHPRTFYPDVRNAERYVTALKQETGSVAMRTAKAQVKTNVGYPRFVAGKAYAFPYSPLIFLGLGVLPDGDAIELGFRHLGLLAAALEPLLAFFLARALLPSSSGLAAAVLAAFVPPIFSRLLIAMAATLVGHVWDAALAIALAWYLRRPSPRRLAAVGACALASLLLYVSSLFTVTALVVGVSLMARRWRPIAVLIAAGLVTVAWLYLPFTIAFVTEIVPAALRGTGGAGGGESRGTGLGHALGRILIFYGWGWPLVALAGLVLHRRAADDAGRAVAAGWGLAFVLLVGLRAFGGGLFRDLKEITFVAPLVCVMCGYVAEDLARTRRMAAFLLVAALAAHGLGRYAGWLEEYRPEMLQIEEAGPAVPVR